MEAEAFFVSEDPEPIEDLEQFVGFEAEGVAAGLFVGGYDDDGAAVAEVKEFYGYSDNAVETTSVG